MRILCRVRILCRFGRIGGLRTHEVNCDVIFLAYTRDGGSSCFLELIFGFYAQFRACTGVGAISKRFLIAWWTFRPSVCWVTIRFQTFGFWFISSQNSPMHENSVPGRVFGSRRDLLTKIFEVRGSPPKICKLFPQALIYLRGAMLIYRLRRFFFFIRIHFPPHVRSRLQIFCETNVQNMSEKNVPNAFFSCKNGPKHWWDEHLYCTRSPLLTYSITECLSARSGFARTVPIYCHLYATVLLIPTAYSHTLWFRNLFIVIIQEMTHVRSIVTLITLIPGMMYSSL